MDTAKTGMIYKGIGGFYYVKTADGIIECKPRGVFRKQGHKPVAGDRVRLGCQGDTAYIEEILPRANLFVRPPIANVDQFFLVASTTEPLPAFLVLDTMAAIALDQGAQPVLVITKGDLAGAQALLAAYATSGIPVIEAAVDDEAGLQAVRSRLVGKLSVFCGNSGVGKSTLLNALLPAAARETGDISKKLGRGRHTTREVEIFEVAGGLVADTPGFASLDMRRMPILKENLQFAFPEIESRMQECRFTGCAHMAEAGCVVRAAVERGEISQSRYASYAALYEEAKRNEAHW